MQNYTCILPYILGCYPANHITSTKIPIIEPGLLSDSKAVLIAGMNHRFTVGTNSAEFRLYNISGMETETDFSCRLFSLTYIKPQHPDQHMITMDQRMLVAKIEVPVIADSKLRKLDTDFLKQEICKAIYNYEANPNAPQ